MRYLVTHINPLTGKEGMGSDHNWFMEYASARNVVRFGLRKIGIPPGQFHIYSAPHGTFDYKLIQTAYKRV